MDLSAFTEAVGELHEFLSEQLMKVENVKDQIILIDQFIFKLQQYRERITYRVGTNIENSYVEVTSIASPFSSHELQRQNDNDTEEATDCDAISKKYFVDEIKEESDYIVEKESDDIEMEKVVENIIVVHEEKATDIQESNAQSQQEGKLDDINFLPEFTANPEQCYTRSEHGYTCNICKKILSCSSKMKYHVRDTHGVGGTLHKCQVLECSYSTLSSSQFRAHKSWHANNATLTCLICKKDYLGGAKGLRSHMKIHSKSREFRCDICNKEFINLSRLNFHIQNVHGDQTYLCEFCNKQFRSKANFTRHQLIHVNEKPYNCPFCNFSTAGSTSLTSHVRIVHKEHDFTAGKANKLKKKESRANVIPSGKTVHIQNVVNKECENIYKIKTKLKQSEDTNERRQSPMKSVVNSSLKRNGIVNNERVEDHPLITVMSPGGKLVRAVVKVDNSQQNSEAVLHVVMQN